MQKLIDIFIMAIIIGTVIYITTKLYPTIVESEYIAIVIVIVFGIAYLVGLGLHMKHK